VYILRIIGLTKQNDMQSLVKILLKMPGLNPELVSMGLKMPPLKVLSVEQEEQVQAMKNTLEKLGAMCEVVDTDSIRENPNIKKKDVIPLKTKDKHFELRFWLMIFTVLALFILFTIYFSNDNNPNKPILNKPEKQQIIQSLKTFVKSSSIAQKIAQPSGKTNAEKNKGELSDELARNPYNTEAWKALSEKLEAEGDIAAANTAKENYEKSEKVQMVLASLAKAFGNNVRVEVREDVIFYRTSKDFSESEFYYEAEKLRDSLSLKFPGKQSLIVENYTSNNTIQRIVLEPSN
jgi:hypothetical protein